MEDFNSIKSQIVKELNSKKLSDVLPSIIDFAQRTGSIALKQLCVNELYGYDANVELPEYRKIPVILYDKNGDEFRYIIRKTKRSEKIKRSVPPRKTKRSFFRSPHNAKRLRFLWGVCCLFFITFQTFKSNFTFSSPSSSNLVRSKLFSYMCTFPRFSVMFFSGRSICRAMR